jgi:hypothetical protein
MTTSNDQPRPGEEQSDRQRVNPETGEKKGVTHNLDTGEDEPLPDLDDENMMDFGSGSGGGSAGDGGAS